jgi:hypothetical protein
VPEESSRQYLFDRPGHYQIRVVGELDPRWRDNLQELEITTISWKGYPRVTQITGWLSDQTALSGLLDLLNDLSMVILTVERDEQEVAAGKPLEGTPRS